MRVNQRFLSVFLLGMTLLSCSSKSEKSIKAEELITDMFAPSPEAHQFKIGGMASITQNGMEYQFSELKALDFLKRKSVKVAETDLDDLSQESIFIVDVEPIDQQKKELFDEQKNHWSGHLRIIQQQDSIIMNNAIYERSMNGKVRGMFFLSEVNLSKEFEIEYYDDFSGEEIIKIKKYTID